MEFLKIWNDYGQSYINHMKEMERESAVKAAALTAKLCSSTQHHNQIAHNQNQHHHQQQHHNRHQNEANNQKPAPSTTVILSKTATTTTTSSASLTIPSPPASRTSSNASSPGSAHTNATTTVATSTSTAAATAAAFLHLQQLQQQRQQFQVEQVEQQQQRQRLHHHQHQQHQMQHHHEMLQQQQQNFQHAQAYHHAAVYNQQQQQQRLHDDSHVTNSLLWQPWRDLQHAAAVHHHLYQQQLRKEARLTAKELPTAKWRRERRMRTAEYHTTQSGTAAGIASSSNQVESSPPPSIGSPERLEYVLHPVPHDIAVAVGATPPTSASPSSPMSMVVAAATAAANMRPLCESNNRLGSLTTGMPSSNATAFIPQHAHQHSLQTHHQQQLHVQQQQQGIDSPLDMTVPHSLKQRSSPPPPYREPLPGSSYASSLARPSVITQAPSKRLGIIDGGLDLATSSSSMGGNQILISNRENENRSTESVSMCENVIDEHFRRSLGADYAALFGKRSPAQSPQSPQPTQQTQNADTPPPPPLPPTLPSATLIQPPMATLPTVAHKQLTLHAVSSLVGMQPPPPAYHQTPLMPTHPLISPKPAAVLLSPAAIAAAAGYKKDEQRNTHSPLLPPQQQQPLSLHRSASNSPCSPTSPQSLAIANTNNNNNNGNNNTSNVASHTLNVVNKNSSHMQRLAAKRLASPQPAPLARNTIEPLTTIANTITHSHSPTPSPSHTPPVATVTSTTPAVVLPAIMRIKTEPGLSALVTTTTPPASPNSASNTSITNSDVLASVDDHFAKALGDTWKKLQERK